MHVEENVFTARGSKYLKSMPLVMNAQGTMEKKTVEALWNTFYFIAVTYSAAAGSADITSLTAVIL